MVTPSENLTPEIIAQLKNYVEGSGLFIDDTVVSIVRRIRIDTQDEYCILKVAESVTPNRIRDYLPGYGTGNDPYKRIYAGNNSFNTFLKDNFTEVEL